MKAHDKFQIGRAALLRGLDFGQRGSAALPLIAAILFFPVGAMAQMTNDLSDAEIQGRNLTRQLLEQRPGTNFVQTGVLNIRAGGIRPHPVIPSSDQTPAACASRSGRCGFPSPEAPTGRSSS